MQQIRKPGAVNFGIEVGTSMNGFYHNSSQNMMNSGFHVGGLLNITINDHMAVQPGLFYEKKGNIATNTISDGPVDITTRNTYTMNYIEVPANFVYRFGSPREGRFMVGVGPYVSYLYNAKNSRTSDYTDNSASPNSRIGGADNYLNQGTDDHSSAASSDGFRKLDWGMGCFAGCEMPKGFYARAGAELGLRNLQGPESSCANRNYSFMISIGQIIGK